MKQYQNFIDGQWLPAKSARTFQNANPADVRNIVAEYPLSDREDATVAIVVAKEAWLTWSKTSPVMRGRILSRAAQLIERRKMEFAELLTREEGKTFIESSGEVQRAVDIFRFFGSLSYQFGGAVIPHELPENLILTRREPLGVVGLITPWNFPIAIPAWKIAPALLSGNTVVVKPASHAPAMTLELAAILAEAGLPKGVLNVVVGDGSSVGGELASNPHVAAVSFTGSYSVGHQIYQQLTPRMARGQMEMGGKNPTIVLADADLDLAAKLVAISGFGLTGQACTATSRVIVEKSVATAFTEKLIEQAQAIKIGNGLSEGVKMGPAISQDELEGIFRHIHGAMSEGAKLLHGGQRFVEGDLQYGYFISPTVLGGVNPAMRIANEEVFGPVIGVIEAENFNEAILIANGVDTGLSASILTRNLRNAMLYTDQIQAGVVKVNQVTTGLALQAPFGGMKKSSTDSFKEQGPGAIEFYTRLKTIYLDYSV